MWTLISILINIYASEDLFTVVRGPVMISKVCNLPWGCCEWLKHDGKQERPRWNRVSLLFPTEVRLVLIHMWRHLKPYQAWSCSAEGGGHTASLPAGAPKMCSICPNLTLVWGLWRAPAPSMRNDKLKVLTAAATVGGGGWGGGGALPPEKDGFCCVRLSPFSQESHRRCRHYFAGWRWSYRRLTFWLTLPTAALK